MEQTDIWSLLDKVIRWITPFITLAVGVIITLFRMKLKEIGETIKKESNDRNIAIKEEKEDREKNDNNIIAFIKELEMKRDQLEKDNLITLRDSLKEESVYRNEMFKQHNEQIIVVASELRAISLVIAKLEEKLTNNIAMQEKICEMNHTQRH